MNLKRMTVRKKDFPTLQSLSNRLNENEKLLILSRGHRYLLHCVVGTKIQKCKAKRLSQDFDYLISTFRQELLEGDKPKALVSNVSSEIYEQTIADSIPDGTTNLYLYIGSNLVSIPFNVLKKFHKTENFFGKAPITLVPSLFDNRVTRMTWLLKLIIWVLVIPNSQRRSRLQISEIFFLSGLRR